MSWVMALGVLWCASVSPDMKRVEETKAAFKEVGKRWESGAIDGGEGYREWVALLKELNRQEMEAFILDPEIWRTFTGEMSVLPAAVVDAINQGFGRQRDVADFAAAAENRTMPFQWRMMFFRFFVPNEAPSWMGAAIVTIPDAEGFRAWLSAVDSFEGSDYETALVGACEDIESLMAVCAGKYPDMLPHFRTLDAEELKRAGDGAERALAIALIEGMNDVRRRMRERKGTVWFEHRKEFLLREEGCPRLIPREVVGNVVVRSIIEEKAGRKSGSADGTVESSGGGERGSSSGGGGGKARLGLFAALAGLIAGLYLLVILKRKR